MQGLGEHAMALHAARRQAEHLEQVDRPARFVKTTRPRAADRPDAGPAAPPPARLLQPAPHDEHRRPAHAGVMLKSWFFRRSPSRTRAPGAAGDRDEPRPAPWTCRREVISWAVSEHIPPLEASTCMARTAPATAMTTLVDVDPQPQGGAVRPLTISLTLRELFFLDLHGREVDPNGEVGRQLALDRPARQRATGRD